MPGQANVGELVDLARPVASHDELCGCGDTFSACTAWTSVKQIPVGCWTYDLLIEALTAGAPGPLPADRP